MNEEKPWWWPEIIDDAYLAYLRDEYPDKSEMDDESLLEYFDDGKNKGGFSTTWKHLGVGIDTDEHLKNLSYQKLAHAFLSLVMETGKTPSDFGEI